jgi:hypothetical protein
VQRRRRAVLATIWALFVVAWCFAAFVAFGATMLVPCGGDGGQPYAAPDSPAGRYCTSIEDYFESGEPGELTTALVYLSPVGILVAFGAVGVWRRSARFLVAAAALALGAIGVHVALAFSLPNRCSPDDPTAIRCEHY